MVYMAGSRLLSVALSVCLSAVLAAPVSQQQSLDALRTQIRDQEKALESLAAMSVKDGSNTNTNGMEFSKTKSFSYTDTNGAENKVRQEEEKVLDPSTGKLLSDIKEKVEQAKDAEAEKPKTSYQASIDIPGAGIHKEISNDNQLPESDEQKTLTPEMTDTVEFTPRVVAEYLLRTGERQEFQNLLNELVEAQEISSEEAEQYEKSVMDELYKMEQQSDDVNMQSMEPLYPQGYGEGPQSMYPAYNGLPVQERDDVYPLYGFAPNQVKVPEQNRMDSYINYLLNKPVTLDEMISTLLDEWLNRAIVTDDPEAEEILSNIVDYVSRDNNPNDESQVKEFLSDAFANELLLDLTPRIQPQQLQDVSLFPETHPEDSQTEDKENAAPASEEDVLSNQQEQTAEQNMPSEQKITETKGDLDATLKM